MRIDYTKMFATPDQLADFCMLPVDEQARLEAEYLASTSTNYEMVCDLTKRNQTGIGASASSSFSRDS